MRRNFYTRIENTMEYKSFADLSADIVKNLNKIPSNVDLVVGIPRSGLLAGHLISLCLNIPLIDLDGFIYNRKISHSLSGKNKSIYSLPREAKHILIVDDTVLTGRSMAYAREKICRASIAQTLTFCSVYAEPRNSDKVDIFLERLYSPRAFEWNMMHNNKLRKFCSDIDGVLCIDPAIEHDSDGQDYLERLKNAKPLSLPTQKVGYLITSRHEKYRKATEEWLHKYNIQYEALYMLDPAIDNTCSETINLADFKTQIYKRHTDSILYLVNAEEQAKQIANKSGKPVLSFSSKKLYTPKLSATKIHEKIRSYHAQVMRKTDGLSRRLLHTPEFQQKDAIKQHRTLSNILQNNK